MNPEVFEEDFEEVPNVPVQAPVQAPPPNQPPAPMVPPHPHHVPHLHLHLADYHPEPIVDIDTDDKEIERYEEPDGTRYFGIPEHWTLKYNDMLGDDFAFWFEFLFFYDVPNDYSFELCFIKDQLARQFPNYKWDHKANSIGYISDQVRDCLLKTIEPVVDCEYYWEFSDEVQFELYIHQFRNIVLFMYRCFSANYLCPGSNSKATTEDTTESFSPFKSRLVALAIRYDLITEDDFN
jgi:hypothetical protein